MIRAVSSLQRVSLKCIINYQEIIEVLNPEEEWGNDRSHLFNQRLSYRETVDFMFRVMDGGNSLAQVKSEIRSLLLQRPFDLDLVHLHAIPLFDKLPKYIARQIWIEAFLIHFEARLPQFLRLNLTSIIMDWSFLQRWFDGCENPDLLEVLQEQERDLLTNDVVVAWLLDNLTIDE